MLSFFKLGTTCINSYFTMFVVKKKKKARFLAL